MKKISIEVLSRSLGSRLVKPMFAAGMLAAMSLPFSSVYGGAVTATLSTFGFNPCGMVVSSDGESLFVIATTPSPVFNSELLVYNTQFNTLTAAHDLFFQGTAVRVRGASEIVENPAEGLIFALNAISGTVTVINEATNTQIATFLPANVGPFPIGLAVTPNGKQLWVANSGFGNNNGTVQIIDSDPTSPKFGKAINLVNVGGSPNTITINRLGTLAYVLNDGVAGSGFVDEVRVSTGDIIRKNIGLSPAGLNFPNPLAMAMDRRATTLYIANGFSILNNMDIPSGAIDFRIFMFPFFTPPGFAQQLGQVVLSPRQDFVYTANIGDQSVGVATPATNSAQAQIFLPGGAIPYFLALSPNGRTLYAGEFNNFVAPPFGGNNEISVITGLTP